MYIYIFFLNKVFMVSRACGILPVNLALGRLQQEEHHELTSSWDKFREFQDRWNYKASSQK